MPTVPTINPVQQAGLPNARFSTETNAEAFGGGAAKAAQAGLGLGETTLKIAADAYRRANDTATKQFEQDVNREFNRLLHDPKEGALFTRGQNAFDIEKTYGDKFNQFLTERLNGLHNGDQKSMAQLISQKYKDRFVNQLNQHTGKEIKAYENSLTDNGIKLAREDAILNYNEPGLVDEKINIIEGYIRDHAMNNGLSPEQTAMLVKASKGQTYQGVISKMVDDGDYEKAQQLYDQVSSDIDAQSRDVIQKNLKSGMLLGKSQREADAIWMESGGSYSEALRKAEAIKDPELRKETLSQIRQKQSDANAALQDAQNDAWLAATEYVKAAPGQDPQRSIPVSLWNRLTLEQQRNLRNYSSNPVNDSKAWLDFLELPPSAIASMSRAEFESKYWTKFDESHRGRAETMWKAAQEAKGDSMKLSTTISYKDMLRSTAVTAGLIPADRPMSRMSKEEVERFARFEQAAAIAIEEYELTELGGKRKATNKEKQNVIDELLLKTIQTDRGFLWNTTTERFAFEYGPGEIPKVEDVDSIPRYELQKIKDFMSRNNIIYSSEKAVEMYNTKLQRASRGE